ncbi:PRC-barrel domain-containing protein [Haloarcula salina]|uniref:PRC-barrel domain-containing protein n=1 Tax=Haloarcula salina TaxID=1429914 RepID=A0AA41G262_9EURY|nr:PRC-barrel domain-containing protein [Haloarcula salina]MBV0902835.1 PRC-barrel domain-containing protein [Haloarcula salina]
MVLASTLSDKRVVSSDGREVGNVHNVIINPESGSLQTLVLDTERPEIFGIEADENGRVKLPAAVLETVEDHLIISPPA